MANVLFKLLTRAQYDALQSKDNGTLYRVQELNGSESFYQGTNKLDRNDLDAAEFALASVSEGVVTIKGIKEVDGLVSVGTDTTKDVILAKVATTAAAEDVGYDNTESGLTATDVQSAIDEVAAASAGGVDSKTVYIATGSTSGTEYAAIYNFYQGATGSSASPVAGELIGTINIKKDQFVDEAGVADITFSNNKLYDGSTDVTELIKGAGVTPTAADAGKYGKIVFAVKGTESNKKDTIYFSLKEFIDLYTGGTTAEATVTIDANNVVTVDIVDIDASKITYIAADTTDPEHPVSRQSVKQALTRLDGADSVTGSVAEKIKTVISGLDADLDAVTDAEELDAEKVPVMTGVTEVDGVITAVDSIDVDRSGAATRAKNAVIGSGTGRTGSGTELDPYVYADTIKGVKTLVADKFDEAGDNTTAAIEALDAEVANYTIGTGGAADSNVQADGLKVKVTEVDGVVTGVTASIVSGTYDVFGSASAAETAANGYTDTQIAAALTWETVEDTPSSGD